MNEQLKWDLIRHWEARYRELAPDWSCGVAIDLAKHAMRNTIFDRIVQLRFPGRRSGVRFVPGTFSVVRMEIDQSWED